MVPVVECMQIILNSPYNMTFFLWFFLVLHFFLQNMFIFKGYSYQSLHK